MNEESDLLLKVAGLVVAVIAPVAGFFMKLFNRQVQRIDRLEEKCGQMVTEEKMNREVTQLKTEVREDISDLRKDMGDRLDTINANILDLAKRD